MAGPGQPWPVARFDHYSISLQDCNSQPSDPALMVIWGCGEGSVVLSDAWSFHVNTQRWQKVRKDIPYSGYFSGGGGKIFVVFVVEKQTTKYLPTKHVLAYNVQV